MAHADGATAIEHHADHLVTTVRKWPTAKALKFSGVITRLDLSQLLDGQPLLIAAPRPAWRLQSWTDDHAR